MPINQDTASIVNEDAILKMTEHLTHSTTIYDQQYPLNTLIHTIYDHRDSYELFNVNQRLLRILDLLKDEHDYIIKYKIQSVGLDLIAYTFTRTIINWIVELNLNHNLDENVKNREFKQRMTKLINMIETIIDWPKAMQIQPLRVTTNKLEKLLHNSHPWPSHNEQQQIKGRVLHGRTLYTCHDEQQDLCNIAYMKIIYQLAHYQCVGNISDVTSLLYVETIQDRLTAMNNNNLKILKTYQPDVFRFLNEFRKHVYSPKFK